MIKIITRVFLICFLIYSFVEYNCQTENPLKINKEFILNRPAMQGNPGFFLDDWQEKKNPKIKVSKELINTNQNPTTYSVTDFSQPLTKISKYIFGNNLGHWTSRKFLEEDEFIFNLKDMGIQVVRFPGCASLGEIRPSFY